MQGENRERSLKKINSALVFMRDTFQTYPNMYVVRMTLLFCRRSDHVFLRDFMI